jgi:hypothetical protein
MRCCTGDGGRSSGVALAGGGFKPPQAASVKSRGGERCGKRRAVSVSGVGQEGERKRTTVEVSKRSLMTSKPGSSVCSGMSQAATCVLAWWCPACRWRELGLGSGVERGNLSPRYVDRSLGVTLPPGRERERSKWWKPRGVEYWLRGTGADRLVVVVKPGNAGGAKGTACPGLVGGQP